MESTVGLRSPAPPGRVEDLRRAIDPRRFARSEPRAGRARTSAVPLRSVSGRTGAQRAPVLDPLTIAQVRQQLRYGRVQHRMTPSGRDLGEGNQDEGPLVHPRVGDDKARCVNNFLPVPQQIDVDRPRSAGDHSSPAEFDLDPGEPVMQPGGSEVGVPPTAYIEKIRLLDSSDGFRSVDVRDGVDGHHRLNSLQCAPELGHGLPLIGSETQEYRGQEPSRERLVDDRMRTIYVTFETTHHALWAEELVRERGLASELVPSPPQAHARCNLALMVFAEDEFRLRALLEDEGIPYGIYRPETD